MKRFIFSLFFPLILFIFIELKKNCSKTEGFTGADLQALYQHAYKLFVRESIEKQENTLLQICHNHFEQALKSVRRSITDNDINKHKIFDEILQNKTRSCHHHYHDDDDLYS